jgi:hypothetical protein
VIKSNIEDRRKKNQFGIIVWQFNEIWWVCSAVECSAVKFMFISTCTHLRLALSGRNYYSLYSLYTYSVQCRGMHVVYSAGECM